MLQKMQLFSLHTIKTDLRVAGFKLRCILAEQFGFDLLNAILYSLYKAWNNNITKQ